MDFSKAIPHLSDKDEKLKRIISLLPPPSFTSSKNVFEDLTWLIVEQQIPYRARGIWMKKLFHLMEGNPISREKLLRIKEADWRAQKLSYKKYENIKH